MCSTWAAVGASCPLLVTSATIDAEQYAQRRDRPLDWHAACEWLRARPAQRPTLCLRWAVTLRRHASWSATCASFASIAIAVDGRRRAGADP